MAVTSTKDFMGRLNNAILGIGTLTFTGNYEAGGPSLDFQTVFGVTTKQPRKVIIVGKAGYAYRYDLANKKVLVLYYDYNNAADGPAIELPVAAYPAGIGTDVIDAWVLFG
jgi:hypothetical protein